ncbi:GNAT family N-acetyltransferase [Amycolatopsis arida]|uniref:GNAT family N-acetyltransferase n=1 Tax=Amycolatopsis arida TaxID=587909 RepID=UPI000B865D06|nr:N-acetyltransferase [Amycolatopsis arida]
MIVRREGPADAADIAVVHAEAFARGGGEIPVEVGLVEALRTDDAWLPALSLVATGPDGGVVGHVVCTQAAVGGEPALALGPLGVRPAWQGRGVGQALMHAVLGAADALGEPLVALLGHPGYYPRFGFRPATEYGIVPPAPEWAEAFQVRTLGAYRPEIRGPFAYPAPFAEL